MALPRPRYEPKERPFWVNNYMWRWHKEAHFIERQMSCNTVGSVFWDLNTPDGIYATDLIELFDFEVEKEAAEIWPEQMRQYGSEP